MAHLQRLFRTFPWPVNRKRGASLSRHSMHARGSARPSIPPCRRPLLTHSWVFGFAFNVLVIVYYFKGACKSSGGCSRNAEI
jgi:hypothetical protein